MFWQSEKNTSENKDEATKNSDRQPGEAHLWGQLFSFNRWNQAWGSELWVVGPRLSRLTLSYSCDFLFPDQLMSAVKKGQVSDSRLAILLKSVEETLDKRGPVTVDRSGGGVWNGTRMWCHQTAHRVWNVAPTLNSCLIQMFIYNHFSIVCLFSGLNECWRNT